MTVEVAMIGRQALRHLLVSSNHISLTEAELYQMDACLAVSDEIYAGFLNGDLACVWGLVPPTIMSEQAYLWLYSTSLVKEHKFIFIRQSQIYVEKMLETYPVIVGYCHQNNPQAKKWLQWLGAVFDKESTMREKFTIRKAS